MKRLLAFFLVILLNITLLASQTGNLRVVKQNAFKRGERLEYRVHYGVIDAGEAVLEVTDEDKKISERSTYHLVGTGRSLGAFNFFFKVKDRYESFVDEQAIVPWVFIRRVDEGGYKINQDYIFNQYKNTVNTGEKKFDVPANVQDILSAYYYMRTLSLQAAKYGDVFTVNTFFDDELYPLQIKYVGKDVIKTRFGKVRCLKFKPLLQKGRVFKEEEDMTVWISDDENKIPIRVQADVLVGSIKMTIKNYKNLANDLALEQD